MEWSARVKRARGLRAGLALVVLCSLLFHPPAVSRADSNPRTLIVESQAMATHWQLVNWDGGKTVCDVFTRHDSQPAAKEVVQACGHPTYLDWITTPSCQNAASSGGAGCSGLMLRNLGKELHRFKQTVELPKISFYLEAPNCTPGEWCASQPQLKITAIEPLPDHSIRKIYLRVGGHVRAYDGADLLLELPLTGEQGDWLEYWADSDFGDQSQPVRFKYRSVQPEQTEANYLLDLLSSDWAAYTPSGSLIWNLFPPLEGALSDALDQPLSPDYLYTTNRYVFLAGDLIQAGLADASACPAGGLASAGVANTCGEKAAGKLVLEYQNRYDEQLYLAGLKYNVPARVLKGIIAQESQFWHNSDTPYELGLGMMTENGADMLLTWNLDIFLRSCTLLWGDVACAAGYSGLDAQEQTLLRGSVLKRVGTDKEIDLLGAMLLASAVQANQLVKNTTLKSTAEVTTYEDMWKLTIGNYFSGSGCMAHGLKAATSQSKYFAWSDVAGNLLGDCQKASTYVERVLALGQ